jgi:hypothetical protein
MKSTKFGLTVAAIVPLFLALPLAAGELAAPPALDAKIEQDNDLEMWSLAMIGPATMIFIVAALGLTITVRSLRDDFRHQRSVEQSWRHGVMSRARRTHAASDI